MTGSEFQQWLEVHCELFPAFSGYVVDDRGGGKDELLDALFESLEGYHLEDAKRASRRLLRRNQDLFPSQHLGAMLAILEEPADRVPSSKELAGNVCGTCRGSGMVSVRARAGQFKSGQGRPIPAGTVLSCACPCDTGKRINHRRENPKTDPMSGKPIRETDRGREITTFVLPEFDHYGMDAADPWMEGKTPESPFKPLEAGF